MSPESPNSEPKQSLDDVVKTEQPIKAEAGPLRLSDIKDLSPDQKNEAALKAINDFNASFKGMDPTLVRAALKKADSEITLSDLKAIDELEEKCRQFCEGNEKPPSTEVEEAESEDDFSVDHGSEFTTENATDVTTETLETPAERQARLQAFVAEYFPDCPPESMDQATGICLEYEEEYRDMFEEPDLKLGAEDAEDPDIRATIEGTISRTDTRNDNKDEIDDKQVSVADKEQVKTQQEKSIQENKPKVIEAKQRLPELESKLRDTKAAVTEQKAENANDRKELAIIDKIEDEEEAKNETVSEDLKTVKELQSRFESLKAEKGTIGALKSLLGPDGVKSPDMKTIVKRVLGTAQSLVAAIPGKAAVVERFLNQSSVDFSATAPAQTFAGFLAMVDSSDEFTEEERVQIRRILQSSSPAPASSAAELKDALKNGRGTKQITEIQRVEEPPGSGNFVEKEVVIGTEKIPFTKSEPYVLSNNPLVKLHPVTGGSSKYQVNAIVTNASPINFTVDIPEDGAIPEAAINNQVNQHLLRATLQNANLRGVMDFWYGQGDSTFGAGGETSGASLGGNDMSKAITNMFLGHNTLQGNRFLTASELGRIAHDARWLVPGGSFGGTNKVAGAESNLMMKALFGADKTEITDNMARAHFVINSGGAEDPSFEGLYQSMYPEDTDFARLTEIVGPQAVAALSLNQPDS